MNTTEDLTQAKSIDAPRTRSDEELQQFTRTAIDQIGKSTGTWVLGIDQIVYGETRDGRMFTWFTCARQGTNRRLVKVHIILDADDTYIVKGGYMDRKTFDFTYAHEVSGIYCDQLSDAAVEAAETARTAKR